MYISRSVEPYIKSIFEDSKPNGLIISGIVGCGKTTLIDHLLESLNSKFVVRKYSGDDTKFRAAIKMDSKFLLAVLACLKQVNSLGSINRCRKRSSVLCAKEIGLVRIFPNWN